MFLNITIFRERNIVSENVVRNRKMKCWQSSETNAVKFWGRLRLCFGGKRTFEVFEKNRNLTSGRIEYNMNRI